MLQDMLMNVPFVWKFWKIPCKWGIVDINFVLSVLTIFSSTFNVYKCLSKRLLIWARKWCVCIGFNVNFLQFLHWAIQMWCTINGLKQEAPPPADICSPAENEKYENFLFTALKNSWIWSLCNVRLAPLSPAPSTVVTPACLLTFNRMVEWLGLLPELQEMTVKNNSYLDE